MNNPLKHPAVVYGGAGLFVVIGIIIYVFYDQMKDFGLSIFGVEIFHRGYEAMGRLGFSALFVVLGAIVAYQGSKEIKKSRSEKQ
ncbi:MAG TPA: hypothetical protein VL651_14160 [Bacteroidia bacterium]|jgi:hypothetical protein|nr:hypothetical protein [Bacteroidia bacterium]